MPRRRGLIKLEKYFTQVGQLGRVVRTSYGDSAITSITTVSLALYQEDRQTVISAPANDSSIRLFGCVAATVLPRRGDQLQQVFDQFGNLILDAGRIDELVDYNDPFHDTRFVRFRLDLDRGTLITSIASFTPVSS